MKVYDVIGVDFEEAARARAHNNWEMRMHSSVIGTIFPHILVCLPIFLTSLRQCMMRYDAVGSGKAFIKFQNAPGSNVLGL